MEDIEDIFEGWLERPVEDNNTKGWLKKSFSKKWKKGFYVLRKYCSSDQAFIQWFDKEENWRRQIARGTLELFPQYRVLKRNEIKGKQFVFEVNNDADVYVLAAESETVMDLWVIQLQMQTRLNPRVAGKTFRVRCCGNKAMQRIGAKDQKCLLHVSKWGMTLALERTRAVLAQWPLTTVRNYESMDQGEFSFEAGRRSPMGQGKYTFFTQPGEDNRIFDTIDKFASERLQAQSRGGAGSVVNSEEDMSRAYDQLRFSVLNIPSGNLDEDYDMASSAPRSIQGDMSMMGSYAHLGRSDSIGSGPSIGSYGASIDPSYNSIERHSSFGSRNEEPVHGASNYDFLDHARSQISLSIKEGRGGLGRSPSGYNHISTSSFRGTPDFYKKDMCPLEVSLENEKRLSDDLSSPSSSCSVVPSESNDDPFTMSGEFSVSPENLQTGAPSSSTLIEEDPPPPPLPDRSSKVPSRNNNIPPSPRNEIRPPRDRPLPPPPPPDETLSQNGNNSGLPSILPSSERGKTLPIFGSKRYERKESTDKGEKKNGILQTNEQNNLSTASVSPNFVYLNSSYSKSVEVLPQLYATVDKSKKKKNRELAERRSLEYEASKLSKAKKKSRSHESLAGSPRLNSFSFTPFSFKGLAAMDSSSDEEDYSKDDEDFDVSLISAKAPKSEKVAMALKGSLNRDGNPGEKGELGKINGVLASSVPTPRDMEALQNAIAHSPCFGSNKKHKQRAEQSV